MDYKNFLILVLFFCFFFLILIQTSFLTPFSILGVEPNFVLILVCLLAFFSGRSREKSNNYLEIYLIIITGFLMDIFSSSFFGISVIVLLVIYFFIKHFKKLLKDAPPRYLIVYFSVFIIFSVIIYDFFIGLSYFLSYRPFVYPDIYALFLKIIYNLIFGIIGFYCTRKALARLRPREMRMRP